MLLLPVLRWVMPFFAPVGSEFWCVCLVMRKGRKGKWLRFCILVTGFSETREEMD